MNIQNTEPIYFLMNSVIDSCQLLYKVDVEREIILFKESVLFIYDRGSIRETEIDITPNDLTMKDLFDNSECEGSYEEVKAHVVINHLSGAR